MGDKRQNSEEREKIKRLEEKLRRYEERIEELKREKETLQSLILHSFLGIVTVDKEMRVTSCNQEFEKLFQFKKAEIIGKNLDDLIAGKDSLEEALEFSNQTLTGNATHGVGIRFKKDGTPVTVEFFAVPAIVNGKVVGAYGIYQDVSDREKMSRALKESEERYRKFVNLSPMGIGVYDMSGKILFANRAAAEIAGVERLEDLIGKSVFEFFSTESIPDMRQRLKNLKAGKLQPKMEEKIITLNGQTLTIESTSTPITYQGQPAIMAVFQDVSERVNAQRLLQESEARMKKVFQVSPLGMGLVKNRVMQWHNEAMSKILGYQPEELVGRRARIIYPNDEEYSKAGDAISSISDEKRVVDIETKWVRKNGEIFDCHIWYALLETESEDPAILAIVEDISERKKIEKLHRESEARYRLLIEGSPLPIVVYDENSLYFGNPAALKMFKAKSMGDFTGKSVVDFIHPDSRPMAMKRFRKFMKGEHLP
ncbi:MAG: hypothetical protein DSY91_01380, partial [Deltaproteobacteria bacterium]